MNIEIKKVVSYVEVDKYTYEVTSTDGVTTHDCDRVAELIHTSLYSKCVSMPEWVTIHGCDYVLYDGRYVRVGMLEEVMR